MGDLYGNDGIVVSFDEIRFDDAIENFLKKVDFKKIP